MAQKSLTDTAIKNAKPTGKVYRLRDHQPADPDLKGFHLVVSAGGSKSFAVAYTSPQDGKRRFVTIGRYPDTSLTEARRQARRLREQVRGGVDPALAAKASVEVEKQAQQAEQAAGTVSDVLDLYIEQLKTEGKDRTAKYVSETFEKNVRPAVGHLKAATVTTEQLAAALAPLSRRAPTLAERTRSFLITAFKTALKARKNPKLADRALQFNLTGNPAVDIEKVVKVVKPGTRALSADEIHKLWNTFDGDALNASALRLLLATGQRVEEVLGATWDEFDLEAKVWRIPASRRKTRNKVFTDHWVPLNAQALAALDWVPKLEGCPYVFPHKSLDKPRPSNTLGTAIRAWCARNEFQRFSGRDIRRTWMQRARDAGLGLEVRNRIQGHAFSDVGSQHYDGLDDPTAYLADKTESMARWSRWLDQAVTGKPAKVVSLRA